jgi:hypothetical protein
MPVKKTKPKEKHTMRLSPDLMAKIKVLAAKEDRSQANLVERILREALRKRGEPVDDSLFG